MPAHPSSTDPPADRPVRGWRGAAVRVLGTSFGLGYVPVAPGTFGTLPAVGLFLAVMAWAPRWLHPWALGVSLAAACALAVPLGRWAERYWGRTDPSRFTLDEFAGFLLTVLLFRQGGLWPLTAWAFVATRLFDIIKVPPAWQCQRLPGGWGILMDDLVSSVYAAAALHLLWVLWPAAV